jgi:putative ABC transport system substrate-binding protein
LADCWPKDLTSLSENGSLESTGNVSCGYHRNGQCGNHVSRIWLGPERPRGSQDLLSCHARHSRPREAVVPRLARVAVLWNAANPYPALVFKETQAAGQILGIQVQSLEVRSPGDFDDAFEAARRQRPDALITVEDPLTVNSRKRIADFATAQQLPTLHRLREFVAVGGLMSYGANLTDLRRRAAGYVDKIFKGAKPADLPVQQPTKFELVINLATAKALGLTVPNAMQLLADEVIE